MKNTLKAALREGKATFGSWIQFGNPAIAEMMAQAGFEWLVIDIEHSVIGLEAVQALIQVVELNGSVPLVRLSSNDPVQAKRVMDAGAHGIIVPTVNTKTEAFLAVQSIKYPPEGIRGVGLSRAQAYGARFSEYIQETAQYSIIIVMIEQKSGVENIDDILSVPGIDGILVGPYDLSSSYGVPGNFDHPLMQKAMSKILTSAKKANVSAGIHVVHPPASQIDMRLAQGFRFIAYGGDMLFLLPAVQEAVSQIGALRTSN